MEIFENIRGTCFDASTCFQDYIDQIVAVCKHGEASVYVQDHVIELPESRQIVTQKHLLEQLVCFQEVTFHFAY